MCLQAYYMQARRHGGGGIRGIVPQIYFVAPKFCCSQNNFFQVYNKNKITAPIKMFLSPQTLKPG